MSAFMTRCDRLARLAVLALAVLVAGAAAARAELRVDITRGTVQPMPIAITDLLGQGQSEGQIGRDISAVVSADLERSGLFKPIDKRAFIQDLVSLQQQPRFADWQVLRAQALVSGTVEPQPDGLVRVAFRLWDVAAQQHLTGFAYRIEPKAWRRVAHKIADQIYERITGEKGYFDSRVVYIAESGPANQRVKRLAVMDQDGENNQFLTDGRSLVLTPRYSPTTEEITYLSFFNNRPRVYLFNLETGRQEVLGDFPGMTFAPRFSPDGNRVLMSMAANGNTEIYAMDLRTRRTQQLTNHPAIDTAPSFSDDGSRIVFESDRGGTQQLYVMGADGSDVKRITFGQGRYANPVWSPRGDLIAFTRLYQGRFYIGVIRPDGTGERLITEAYHVEGPTWAPNGRVLMYFKETPSSDGRSRRARLYSIDLTGQNEREVVTPMDASDPAWSPLIP
ncbi:Tol-Pal system beta propeller repeat protein TolB [Arenibaculum pallidiluteum]|uniref:Tol-Pal system beta propeller repeat protein TolB n=1 Tax=Arenibaculum pallidiluteum TaxID=2812559 RepID=UPI001A96048E|nr:Tol-Pal system beta propeller repeat protein TolB [Arenibaculum pallidiluteum]